MMTNKAMWQILNVVALIAVIVLNGLSNGQLVEGRSVGDISDSYPTYFTPAGVTFAIWGLIYLSLLAFAVYQARDLFRSPGIDMPFLQMIGPWFVISCIANGAWLFPWLYQRPLLSLALMLLLLVSLVMIYLQLEIGAQPVSRTEKWLVHAPFSLYLGWITVATIANSSIALEAVDWGGFGLSPKTWAMVMIGIAGLIGFAIGLFRSDLIYALVVIWALIGIVLARQADPEPSLRIIYTAYVSIGVIAIGALLGSWRAAPGIGYLR